MAGKASARTTPKIFLPDYLPSPQLLGWSDGFANLSKVQETKAPRLSLPCDQAYELVMEPQGCRLRAKGGQAQQWGRYTLQTLKEQADDGKTPAGVIRDWPTLPMRALHVDLKYLAPRFDWLLDWLEQLAAWKINAVIMEYEDKFPYSLPQAAHRTAWTSDQLQHFIRRAGELGIEVIPLIQTLGHLEFMLVHERYAHLRETQDQVFQGCPSDPELFELVKTMLSEVIKQHGNLRYLHLGADETMWLGSCPKCKARVKSADKLALYLDHMGKVCQWVKAQGIRPMIWDDIVRWQPQRVTELPKSVVMVYWTYGAIRNRVSDPKKQFSTETYQMEIAEPRHKSDQQPAPYKVYREQGYDVLMAPCWTGGQLVPDVTQLAANCRYLAEEAALNGCMGVASTSWVCLFTPYHTSQHGIPATADSAWNPLPARGERGMNRRPSVEVEFDRRFCRNYLGLEDETLTTALRLLDSGFQFQAGPGIFGSPIGEPTYTDPSFVIKSEGFNRFVAALFRPDWPTANLVPTWEEIDRVKTQALKNCPSRSLLRAALSDQLLRGRRGLDMLSGLLPQAKRHRDYIEDAMVGARARLWRVEHVLAVLSGKPVPPAQPKLRRQLIAMFEKSLLSEDARLLAGRLLVGLP